MHFSNFVFIKTNWNDDMKHFLFREWRQKGCVASHITAARVPGMSPF